jgi:hypothetical protein
VLDNEGYRHTLRIYNTYCFYTATMVKRTRRDVTFIRKLPVLYLICTIFLKPESGNILNCVSAYTNTNVTLCQYNTYELQHVDVCRVELQNAMLCLRNLARFILWLHPPVALLGQGITKTGHTGTATLSGHLPPVGCSTSGPYKPKALAAFICLVICFQ